MQIEGAAFGSISGPPDATGTQPFYPGRYHHTISVGCLTESSARCTNSITGAQIDIAAPGDGVWTTDGTGSGLYAPQLGGASSEAAAHVSGAAALLLAYQPNMTNQVVKDLLEEYAFDLDSSGWDSGTGWGLLRVDRALEQLTPDGGPTCRFIEPIWRGDSGAYQTLSGSRNFTAYAYSADEDIVSVEIIIDGVSVGSMARHAPNIITDPYFTGNNTYYRNIDTSVYADGARLVSLRCEDDDGQVRLTSRMYPFDN